MKVLGILGSPRRGGNSELLLDKALSGASSTGAETEKAVLNELRIRPCQECHACFKLGRCAVDDDFQPLYEKIKLSSGVIISSPVFFTTVSAQLKAMIDRFQCVWAYKYVLKKSAPWENRGKKGIFLSVSALRKPVYFENASTVIRSFFLMIGAEYTGELFCPGIENKGQINDSQELLKRAYIMGRDLAGGG